VQPQDSKIWDKVLSDRFYDHQPTGGALHEALLPPDGGSWIFNST